MSDRHDLDIVAGAYWSLPMRFPQASGWRSLTGVIARAELRERPGGPLLASFGATVREEADEVELSLTAVATRALPASGGEWDLRLEWPDGDVRYPIAGRVTVESTITE